jgi:hypothetical protein
MKSPFRREEKSRQIRRVVPAEVLKKEDLRGKIEESLLF